MVLFVLSLCPFDISVGVGAFVIGLSQISSFFSLKIKYVDLLIVRFRYFFSGISLPLEGVGFFALVTDNSDFITRGGSNILFKSVDRNDGAAYDKTTGVFTTPKTGLYHFYWNILCRKGSSSSVYLYVNVTIRLKFWLDGRHSPGGSIYIRLDKGDTVYLKAVSSSAIVNGYKYSSFGGELIRH